MDLHGSGHLQHMCGADSRSSVDYVDVGVRKFLENLLHTEDIFFHFLDIILTDREQRIYYVTRTTPRALMSEHSLAFLDTHVILLF